MANTFKFGNGNWAVKEDYALAYNDENNNFKPLPFDFTRASSATRVNKQGLIETVGSGKPRIDFLDNTSGHLLLEPSRTNIITNSEQFVDAPTGNTNMDVFSGTIINNDTTSPDGNNNGMRFTANTATGAVLRIYQTDLSTSADTTFTIYAKKGTTDSVSISITGGTATSVTLTDEWQRISVTSVSTSSKFLDVTFTASVGQYIYIFGMQAEAASYATSYISTSGSAVTRVAETSEINSVPNVPTSYPFVMYVEGNHTLGQESGTCGFYDKSNQYYYYSILFASNNKILALSRPQGTENILTSTSTYTDGFHKVAVLFLNDTTVKLYVDGELEATKTDCSNNSFNTSFTDYIIGVFRSISTNSCNIKDFRIFNHELTNTELQQLTS